MSRKLLKLGGAAIAQGRMHTLTIVPNLDELEDIKKAGVRKIRFHDVRHTVASILLSNKIPLVIVSKILGHSKPSVTSDIYYHFIPASSDEASNFMDDLTPTPLDLRITSLVDSDADGKSEITK